MQNKKPDYYKQILEIVSKEGKRPIPIGIILRKLSNKEPGVDKNIFFKNIQSLINSAQLVKLRNGKLVLGYPKADVDMSKIYKGVIRINSKLAGFITEEGKEDSGYFVHKTNLNGALDGDTIEFALLKMEQAADRTLKDAKVLKVLNHAKGFYVGCFKSDGEHYQVETDDKKMYLPVKLEDTTGLTNGTKFLFTVSKFTDTEAICKVAKIIGHINDVGTDILSIVYDNGIEPEFPEEVIEYANQLKLDINEQEKALRKDLTHLDIVTIDPATSKDFDDAVYCEQLEDGTYHLYVSIADVSHYVKMNSCLDLEALKRGCSTYLVDRVIPMLPHNLSDDLCSLNPNVERLALTCEMIIDKKGSFLDIKTYPSIIKSHRRFSYDEVNAFFDGKDKLEKDTPEIKKMLLVSKQLHDILYNMKKNRGYVELQIPEVKIIVNEKCEPIEIKLRETGTAQSMIEDFMVAANEAVTIEALKVKWPFVFRVHGEPKSERVEMFKVEAKNLNFKLPAGDLSITPKSMSNWLINNADNPNLDLVSILMLRTMAKAEYDTKNIGHFGLASKNYTHFTSPIRRYPDLVVHRIYWMYLFNRKAYTDDDRRKLVESLKEYCDKSNEAELRAIQTERDVNALKFAQYMKDHVGEEFDVRVTAVTKFGCFVELPNTIEGLIKLANLKDDFYIYDEKNFQLIGKQSNKIITLGTRFRAKCISSSMADRKIEFEVVRRI